MPASKLSLHGLTQLTGIKVLTSYFLEIFTSWSQFPGEENARFPPLRTPMAIGLSRGSQTGGKLPPGVNIQFFGGYWGHKTTVLFYIISDHC